jgi:hypothetical protein
LPPLAFRRKAPNHFDGANSLPFALRAAARNNFAFSRTISRRRTSDKCTAQTHSLNDERPMFWLPGNSLMQRCLPGFACQEPFQPLVE